MEIEMVAMATIVIGGLALIIAHSMVAAWRERRGVR